LRLSMRNRRAVVLPLLLALLPLGSIQARTEPLSEPAHLANLSRTQFESGRMDSALTLLDSALTIDTASFEAWLVRSYVDAARNQPADALAALRHALQQYPHHPEARLRIAEAFLNAGQPDSAALYIAGRILPGPWQPYALYLRARTLDDRGLIDSAVTVYRRAFEVIDNRDLLNLPVARGEKLSSFALHSLAGDDGIWHPGAPSLFLFWATWSPSSIEALSAVREQLPKAGINYRFLPINTDAADSESDLSAEVTAAAERAGLTDTIWIDPAQDLLTRWSINRLPAIVVTQLNGEVDALMRGWDATVQERVLRRYLAPYSDTTQPPAPPADPQRSRAMSLLGSARAIWRTGNYDHAMRQLARAISAAPDLPRTHVQQADWRWAIGDTLGARMASDAALAADSLNLWALLAAARIRERYGYHQRALDLFRQCLWHDSLFTPAWERYGLLSARQGNITEAQAASAVLGRLYRDGCARHVIRAVIATANGDADRSTIWREAVEKRLRTVSGSSHHWTPAP
jgi:tetratricopeptide (TPR) repeat protein